MKAFKALSPIFHDERCVNCHGAVNPFAPDGDHPEFIDMKEVAKKFLAQPDPGSNLIASDSDVSGRNAELQGIREIAEGNGPFNSKDLIRVKALKPMLQECRRCHVDDWRIPMSSNDFAGRSWKQICRHVKTSSLTNTPVEFLQHMQDDAQVLLGFKGQRGLLAPPAAVPPAMSFDTMAKHANDWIAAMEGQFHPPAECGCEVDGLALQIRHRVYSNPDSSGSRLGDAQFDGTLVFDVLLKEIAPGRYYNDDVVVRRQVEVKHTKPAAWQCAGTGWRDELWQLSADVDEQKQSMKVSFGFVEEASDASWTCKAKGQSFTDKVYVDTHSNLHDLIMPTTEGGMGQRSGESPADQADIRFVQQFESIEVSLIDRSAPRQ